MCVHTQTHTHIHTQAEKIKILRFKELEEEKGEKLKYKTLLKTCIKLLF